MTIDELRVAAAPMLSVINYSTIDPDEQMMFLVEHEGEPVFRVWSIDAAVRHIADLPGFGEMLLEPHPPNLLVRVATLTLEAFEISDVLIVDKRPQLRVVH